MVNINLIYSYNNYFNRLAKYENSINDYLSDREYDTFTVDFNPNDGVTTEQIVNWVHDWTPNYLVVTNINTDEIISRWFVMEAVRTRGKQYRLSLKRDVIADYRSNILNSKAYIEKGIIFDQENPLLLNNEPISVNQVKKSEVKLFDNSKCPWLVMYLKKGVLGTDHSISVNIDLGDRYETLSTPINQWEFYQYINTDYDVINSEVLDFRYYTPGKLGSGSVYYSIRINKKNKSNVVYGVTNTNLISSGDHSSQLKEYLGQDNRLGYILTRAKSVYNVHDSSDYNEFAKYDGKTIVDSQGKYFKISVVQIGTANEVKNVNPNDSSAEIYNKMTEAFYNGGESVIIPNNNAFKVRYDGVKKYRLSIEEITDIEGATLNTQTATVQTDSSLYDIICMPYGEMEVDMVPTSGTSTHTSKETSLAIMNSIARELTSQYVLDLQLVPYCPVQNYIVAEGVIQGSLSRSDWLNVTFNQQTIAYVIVAPNATFSFTIPYEIELPNLDYDVSRVMKFTNDCTSVRLCSPNYNGVFEFNVAKNGGSVNSFDVDITYKPYNPYIHINPNFSHLYGRDFDDARGLICGGDFSLGIINDAWNVYEIQNKNYQNIFDRQIQNLDFNQAIQKREAGWQMVAGVGQGAVGGAVAGGMVGGVYGAAAGALIGAGASLAGGIADMANLSARQQEARNLSVDMYNLQLGNVRALPNSITRTSAITANNKLVPVLEFYECTDTEREAYFNKIEYDGMTVGIIDNISNWAISYRGWTYLKCSLIRDESISEDNHLFNTIYEELAKGVYF